MGLVGADRHRLVCRGLAVRAEAAAGACGLWPMGDLMGGLFQSDGGAARAILEGIRNAKFIILMQGYVLHSTRLDGALVRAHQRGVQVHVILDAYAQPHHPPVAAVARLVAAGIAVSLDAQHA
jgi:hypothetical protein